MFALNLCYDFTFRVCRACSVKADTDDEAETETAVKRRESSTLAVDGEMGEPIGRPRRATVSGSGSRPSLRAKQLLVLQQQEGRPKSCVVTSGGEEAAAGGTHRSLPTSNLPSPEHLAVAGKACRLWNIFSLKKKVSTV